MDTKYIRHQNKFLVFNKNIVHREIAKKGVGQDALIHGAGFFFVNVVDGKLIANCSGKSESLNVSVRRDDHSSIFKSIGIQTEEEIDYAKYISWRGKVVIFDKSFDYKKIAEASFYGSFDCESSGLVKIFLNEKGKVVIECKSEENGTGSLSNINDYIEISSLLSIPRNIVEKYNG